MSRLRRPWGVRFRSPPGETASGFHNWGCKPGTAKKVAGEFARGTYNTRAMLRVMLCGNVTGNCCEEYAGASVRAKEATRRDVMNSPVR